LDLITVVTGFTGLMDTVTASRQCACIRAHIIVDFVTIIARFDACIYHSIAAASSQAGAQTGIGILFIAIIASLITHIALFKVLTRLTITAIGDDTGV